MPNSSVTISPRSIAPKVTMLDISGELTGASEDALMAAYSVANQNGARTIGLNFNDLEYMNSSGIGLLVTLLIRVQRNMQSLIVIGLNDHYQQIFELTRLNEALLSYPSEAAALAASR